MTGERYSRLTIRIPTSLRKDLRKAAAKKDCSMGKYILELIKDDLEKYELEAIREQLLREMK